MGSEYLTLASLFTGFGLADIGAGWAGLTHRWGVECNPAIAAVANDNGLHVQVGRVQDENFSEKERTWGAHWSPVCKEASRANADGEEGAEDVSAAEACVRHLEALRPVMVTLENVWAYRNFEAFRRILAGFERNGYAFEYWHLCAADYGVPQTRERLILVASREYQPVKPAPTHRNPAKFASAKLAEGALTLFDLDDYEPLPPWRGWYDAIAPIAHTLPIAMRRSSKRDCEWGNGGPCTPGICRGHFADWQIERLPEELRALLINGQNAGQEWGKKWRDAAEPCMSLTGYDRPSHMPKAMLVDQLNYSSNTRRAGESPAFTVTAHSDKHPAPRALLISNGGQHGELCRDEGDAAPVVTTQTAGRARALLVPGANDFSAHDASAPAVTVTPGSHRTRAFIVEGSAAGVDNRFTMPIRHDGEPVFTQRARQNNPRALLVGGQYESPNNVQARMPQNRGAERPVWTLCASDKLDTRALLLGQPFASALEAHPSRRHLGPDPVIVQLTPLALLLLQSGRMDYRLPASPPLACEGIGNGVPCDLAKAVVGAQLKAWGLT